MQYAKETSVPVDRTRAEIERIVSRYGATGFLSGWQGMKAMITFTVREKQIRFIMILPAQTDRAFHATPKRKVSRSPKQAYDAWEQACRQRWRALLLSVKAKLEAVESGIASFEEEFLPYFVIPGTGMTVGQAIAPQLTHVLTSGEPPRLLPGPDDVN